MGCLREPPFGRNDESMLVCIYASSAAPSAALHQILVLDRGRLSNRQDFCLALEGLVSLVHAEKGRLLRTFRGHLCGSPVWGTVGSVGRARVKGSRRPTSEGAARDAGSGLGGGMEPGTARMKRFLEEVAYIKWLCFGCWNSLYPMFLCLYVSA